MASLELFLEKSIPKSLKNKRVAGLFHPASVLKGFVHSLDYMVSKGVTFKALLGPQHGIKGETQDNMIEWEGYQHPNLKIPVYSLYGEFRKPTKKMLTDIDVVFIDLQDIGARYYTFIWSLFLCMERCEEMGIPVVVHNRPNPISCPGFTEGPILDLEYTSFVGLHSIPIRHSQTIGDLARQFKKERFPKVQLEILEMTNYLDRQWFDQTGLPWVLPSPNMPTIETAIIYPGQCLLEGTNLSEGRGTTRPFELFGAPFIDAEDLCKHLNSLKLPGLYFRPFWFIPTFHKWAGEICAGAQIHILNRDLVRSFDMTVEILKYCFQKYPKDFHWRTQEYEYEKKN